MKRSSRRATWLLWYQVHKYFGLATLAFMIMASVTGVVLVYDKHLDAALNPSLFAVPTGQSTMDSVALATRIERTYPRIRVIAVPLKVPAGTSAVLTVAPRQSPGAPLGYDQLFVDPRDGHVLGTRQNGPGLTKDHWIQDIYALHTTLFAGRVGGRLMGAIGVIWLVETMVGVYLTLPRQGPFLAKWKLAWRVGWRDSWPRLVLDLHRGTGLWAFPITLVLAYSAFAIGLYDEVLLPAVSAISPPRPSVFDVPPPSADGHEPTFGFARAVSIAMEKARRDGVLWPAAVATYLPDRGLYGVMFTRSGVEEYSGLGPITYYLDDRSASQYVDNVYADTVGAKVLRATYPIHSGQVGGNMTRWLVIVVGFLVFGSSMTGLLVWLRRRRASRPVNGSAYAKAQ